MRSKQEQPQVALLDIAENIHLAQDFVKGMAYDVFESDMRTIYAVTYCLLIISEASRRLPVNLKNAYPHIPWTAVAASGNVYRHEYDQVLEKTIWGTVHHSLQDLKSMAEAELKNFPRS